MIIIGTAWEFLDGLTFATTLVIKTALNTGASSKGAQLTLYDATDKPVLKEQWNTVRGEASHTINVSHRSKRIYMAVLRLGNEVVRIKVVK